MHPLDLTRSAIGWFLVVLLTSTVLLYILSFLSPFVAAIKYDGAEEVAHAKDLMEWSTKRLPWLAPLYLVAVWKLAKTLWPRWMQVAIMSFAILVVCLPLFQRISPPAGSTLVLDAINVAGTYTLFLLCAFVVWRNLSASKRGT